MLEKLFQLEDDHSYTRYRDEEITKVINKPTGELKTVTTQYPAKLGTDECVNSAIDFHSLTYSNTPRTKTEMNQFPDQYTSYTYRTSGLSMIENSFVIGLIATLLNATMDTPMVSALSMLLYEMWALPLLLTGINHFYGMLCRRLPKGRAKVIFGVSLGVGLVFASQIAQMALLLLGLVGVIRRRRAGKEQR